MITENLSTLHIHKLSKEQYDKAVADNKLNPNALYLTPDNDNEFNLPISTQDEKFSIIENNLQENTASGMYSHAEGDNTTASNTAAHAEGVATVASGEGSHAEGNGISAKGSYSHAEGVGHPSGSKWEPLRVTGTANSTTLTYSGNNLLAVVGTQIRYAGVTVNIVAIDVSNNTITTDLPLFATDKTSVLAEVFLHPGGFANGKASHTEGWYVQADGTAAHAEGSRTKATGDASHAEGGGAEASGQHSHAEGHNTKAISWGSHAEGSFTKASGTSSHAEGSNTSASGYASHSEGGFTEAAGNYSHAEGYQAKATNDYAHAEGYFIQTGTAYQHVQGKFNKIDTSMAHIVGWGDNSGSGRKNIHGISKTGSGYFKGDVYVNTDDSLANGKKVATEEYVNNKQHTITANAYGDGVITLTGTSGTNAVTYTAAHAAQNGLTNGYTSGNSATTINSPGAKVDIKIPQITVDKYGHVTAATDETISITLPNAAALNLSGAMKYGGSSSTQITDGGAQNPTINGKTITATTLSAGSVVLYGNQEFVWTGSKWELLGDEGSYKIKQTAVPSPSTTNAYTGEFIDTISQDANGVITPTKKKVRVAWDNVTSKPAIATGTGINAIIENNILNNVASGYMSHAEGDGTIASGSYSHAEGTSNGYSKSITAIKQTADKVYALSGDSGDITITINDVIYCPSTGKAGKVTAVQDNQVQLDTDLGINNSSSANVKYFHSQTVRASGSSSHAEGRGTSASGISTHAEGDFNKASGDFGAHAEGCYTEASGKSSHTEGQGTKASGAYAHAEGYCTIANANCQHVQGQYNAEDSSKIHIVGYGYASNRKNIHAINTQGTAYFAGDVYVNGTDATLTNGKKLATEEYVNTNFLSINTDDITISSNLVLQPAEGEGGQIIFRAAKNDTKNKHLVIDNCWGDLRLFSMDNNDSNSTINLKIDKNGNAYFAGSVYVGGMDNTNGKELATKEYVSGVVAGEISPFNGGTITNSITFNVNGSHQNMGVKWSAVSGKNPYIGYATDQSDGTFALMSIEGTTHESGLAIGGTSGNLLWKGKVVATEDFVTGKGYVTENATKKYISDQGFITATAVANNYVQKVSGKGLSTNDYTTAEKSKLDSIPFKIKTVSGSSQNTFTKSLVFEKDIKVNGVTLTVNQDYGMTLPTSTSAGRLFFMPDTTVSVIEQTSAGNGWYYRKWENGIAECWGSVTINIAAGSWSSLASIMGVGVFQTGNLQYSYPITFSTPPTETITASCKDSFAAISTISHYENSTTKTNSYRIVSNAKADRKVVLNFYAIGTYKT